MLHVVIILHSGQCPIPIVPTGTHSCSWWRIGGREVKFKISIGSINKHQQLKWMKYLSMICSADTLLALPVPTVPHLDMDPTPVSNKILSVQILIKQSNQKNLEFFIKSEKHEVLLSLMLLIMWERMNRWEKNEGKFHVKTH